MRIIGARYVKTLLNRIQRSDYNSQNSETESPRYSGIVRSNPVNDYYRHKTRTYLPVFYRFALQSRSLVIRDVFAKAATDFELDLADLLTLVQEVPGDRLTSKDAQLLRTSISSSVLLSLANLLANTARNDLDTHAAVQIYAFVRDIFGIQELEEDHKLHWVEALNDLEVYEESAKLAEEFDINASAPLQKELLDIQQIRRSSLPTDDWLAAMNRLYASLNMSPVRLIDDRALPLMDRLSSGPFEAIEGPRVSVIMPTYSPGPGIRTAIRGLLQQTWQNLEIIVVNDASPAQYLELFAEIEDLDPRVLVLHQTTNAGPYAARNAGLAIASGEFVTTHDDDDWSHPEKIALQVRKLLKDDSIVATTSAHIRTTEDLEFRRINMHARFLQMNYSSLMFRKSIVEKIGDWDTVNRGGDSEFYTRVIEYAGEDRVKTIMDRPLSFSRVWDGSLTSGEMSRGYFAYSRLLYRWAFRQWQWDMGKAGQKAIRVKSSPRPYAIPTTFEAGQRDKDLGKFDVVYVTDFFRQAKYVDYVLNELKTLHEAGLRVGYIHLYSPETTTPAGFPNELFELQQQGHITQISMDDQATTKLLIVYDASIGMFADQLSAKLKSRDSVVIMHQLSDLVGAERRTPTSPMHSLLRLDRCFDTQFRIVGATLEDCSELLSTTPAVRQRGDISPWTPHVRTEPDKITPPAIEPTVGFHSYGNQYRWPKNSAEFQKVYDSNRHHIKLYGQLDTPIQKFGKDALANIELVDMKETGEEEFLSSIDFWVYFPHERLIDQIWEPVLMAMQAGKVVILPHSLQKLYKNAAVYAEINEIADIIDRLTSTTAEYRSQALAGQRFIAEHFSKETYLQRIKVLQA